ncbi:GntR family transcriptional regulator [Scopulibacillus darangshiensis]|uniref:GntR family transcriptional regulator n=1 Tax=Scopulibacillus darangshiensis TaxID=442528 RepID=A0A4R2NHQ3_9BACL|nr:UTRA domain-containing protein [Scopulibacillus darangshiensis]TCP20772.1 GntR family transcriptional regulator [Scopulibacillus darangshiensis]
MKLNGDSAKPLYEQLKNVLKEEIHRGIYKYGEKIPPEPVLCENYGVSRITARRAVSDLVKEDILDRQQGKGTFVKHHAVTRELLTVNGFSDNVKTEGKEPHSKVVSKEIITSTPYLEEGLEIPEGTKVLKLVRLLLIENGTVILDIAHYPLNRFPKLADYIGDSVSTYETLREVYHVQPSYNKRKLNIVLATKKESEFLNCELGEPLFEVKKLSYDSNKVPVHTSTLYAIGKNVTFTVNDPMEEK